MQRINSLLFTSDLDVLVLALNLLLRPAQQYSAQQSVAQALNISTPRLLSLCKRWANFREFGVSLADLASTKGSSEVEALPAEAREVNFTFYRKDVPIDTKSSEPTDTLTVPPQTPLRKVLGSIPSSVNSAPSAVNIQLGEGHLENRNPMDVLADVVEEYTVPSEERFELLCRIRTAMALLSGREEERASLTTIRLLALAIFCHTHSENQANSSLFLYEPDLVTHIAELLQLDRGISISVQTAAVAALDALARYRGKISEVLAAVNAGVNHGILLALLRHTISDVANPESTLPHSFVDALLSFVTFLASHGAGGNMVVAAGLVPILVQTMENRLPNRLPVISKTMQLVDNVLYGFANAFQLFVAGRGVDVLVGRIEVRHLKVSVLDNFITIPVSTK
jgi:E3 ubiquitin-protein ligase HUWE1